MAWQEMEGIGVGLKSANAPQDRLGWSRCETGGGSCKPAEALESTQGPSQEGLLWCAWNPMSACTERNLCIQEVRSY